MRRDVAFVITEYRYSERQACKLLDLDRASYRYAARPDRNMELQAATGCAGAAKTALRVPTPLV